MVMVCEMEPEAWNRQVRACAVLMPHWQGGGSEPAKTTAEAMCQILHVARGHVQSISLEHVESDGWSDRRASDAIAVHQRWFVWSLHVPVTDDDPR